jgi:hypothetical protein
MRTCGGMASGAMEFARLTMRARLMLTASNAAGWASPPR